MSGGFITTKDDYGYIAQFIDYLRQIIDMLIKLFKSFDDTKTDAENKDEAAAQ